MRCGRRVKPTDNFSAKTLSAGVAALALSIHKVEPQATRKVLATPLEARDGG